MKWALFGAALFLLEAWIVWSNPIRFRGKH